jgi:hypothetical protein
VHAALDSVSKQALPMMMTCPSSSHSTHQFSPFLVHEMILKAEHRKNLMPDSRARDRRLPAVVEYHPEQATAASPQASFRLCSPQCLYSSFHLAICVEFFFKKEK